MSTEILPLISVIIPAYNAERYLSECVKSIMCNTYRNLEIIIIDDGSKDNTLQIARQLKEVDSRVVVLSQENSGVSKARNKGIDVSKGDYIAFVDADDRIREDYFEKLIKPCIEQGADSACCGYKMVDEHGNTIPDNRKKFSEDFFISPFQIANNYFDCLNMGFVNFVFRIYKKSTVGASRFSETLKWGEDGSFNLEVFKKANKIYVSHEEMYFYLAHPGQATAKKMKGYADMMTEHIGDIDKFIALYNGYDNVKIRQGMGKVCLEVSVECVYHSESLHNYKEMINKFSKPHWYSYVNNPGKLSLRWKLIYHLLLKKCYGIVYLLAKTYTIIAYLKRKTINLKLRLTR